MKTAGRRPARKGWAVVCPDNAVFVADKATAERRAVEIDKLGACMWPHRVVECRKVP